MDPTSGLAFRSAIATRLKTRRAYRNAVVHLAELHCVPVGVIVVRQNVTLPSDWSA